MEKENQKNIFEFQMQCDASRQLRMAGQRYMGRSNGFVC